MSACARLVLHGLDGPAHHRALIVEPRRSVFVRQDFNATIDGFRAAFASHVITETG